MDKFVGSAPTLDAVVLPLLLGVLASVLFLRWRSKVSRVSLAHGLVSWLLFVVSAFVGELASHAVFPQFYEGIGDNPGQVMALVMVLFFSPIINLIAWSYFRRRRPTFVQAGSKENAKS